MSWLSYGPYACLLIFGTVAVFGIIGLILIDKDIL